MAFITGLPVKILRIEPSTRLTATMVATHQTIHDKRFSMFDILINFHNTRSIHLNMMHYLLPITLVILSYFLGVYFAFQGLRNPINRPLIYRNEGLIFILNILFGWVPLIIAVYLALKYIGLIFALVIIVVRFILLTSLLNDKIKSFLDKVSI